MPNLARLKISRFVAVSLSLMNIRVAVRKPKSVRLRFFFRKQAVMISCLAQSFCSRATIGTERLVSDFPPLSVRQKAAEKSLGFFLFKFIRIRCYIQEFVGLVIENIFLNQIHRNSLLTNALNMKTN